MCVIESGNAKVASFSDAEIAQNTTVYGTVFAPTDFPDRAAERRLPEPASAMLLLA